MRPHNPVRRCRGLAAPLRTILPLGPRAGLLLVLIAVLTNFAHGQVAVHGKKVYTMAGAPIDDGMVVIERGKISAIGRAGQITVPAGFTTLEAEVVTPGLIDAHGTLGFSGILNSDHDQDQLERSSPLQPELRAIDAFNAQEDLIEWVRGFGITTIHAGHAPGELMSGQTLVAKTTGHTAAAAVIVDAKAVAVTIGPSAQKTGGKSPGTRGKTMAMLRAELIKAREYRDKLARATAPAEKAAAAEKATAEKPAGEKADKPEKPEKSEKADPAARDLRMETLGRVLAGELPLMITAHKAQDIASSLRLAKEFGIKLWLDGADEAYLLIDEIKAAGVPVLVHPTMTRAYGEHENLSMTTASKLVTAGVPVALQSGYEAYVPKTRVVLFEAAVAAANGLSFEQALATVTISAARILGIDQRVGSLEVGKDGDLALYDGDPFEYTSHCTGTVIEGRVVSDSPR